METSWLFPDGVDRERMLDMDRRLAPIRGAAFLVLGLALVASGPWLGWWTLVPLGFAAIAFRLAEKMVPRSRRPEIALFLAWASTPVILGIAVALTGGPNVPTMSWFAIPIISLSARFSERGTALGVGLVIAIMLGVAFGVDAHAVIASPPKVIAPFALLVSIALFQTVLMRSDVDTRAEAVIDPLTGMLNRKALDQRGAELEQQSLITGQPIGLIVGDIDHFKRVNDSHGHAAGDAVLKDVAYEMRKQLRAFDLFYRIGGEEFLILLPGADLSRAALLAEQLREAIAAEPRGGHAVTMSFGVAASTAEAGFKYAAVFAEADGRLYEAKRGGRNRVFPAVGEPAEPTLAAPA
jgi:diguanylate cyclase (GGDEF)-like protein